MKLKILTLFLLFLCPGLMAQFYNGSEQDFGKNRVQYQDFYWQYYRYKYFNVYFYKEGEDLAEYVSKRALEIMPEMEDRLDFPLEDKVQFIVYKSYSDFKQSNVGLNEGASNNIGGATRIVGNKVFVFYEGTKAKLDEQIRSGIAEVILNQIIYGGDITEMLRSSTFLSLPEWYRKGLVSYLSEGWNSEIENYVKDGIISGRYEYFNRLTGEEARYAGHSIWYYIARTYGEKVLANILYMTRVTRNIEAGFGYVLGLNLDVLSMEHMEFFNEKFAEDEAARNDPRQEQLFAKVNRNQHVTHTRISPNGKTMAYVTNILGQYRIYLYDIKNDKRKKIEKGDHKINRIVDDSHPILAWHPKGDLLAYTQEIRGKLFLSLYSVSSGKTTRKEILAIDNILDMDFSNSGKLIVFSGVDNGQTDLYKYYLVGNRQEKLTDDVFDDLNPRFVKNDEAIVFSSNRTKSALGYNKIDSSFNGNFDIYLYHLDSEAGSLEQITFTPEDNELEAFEYGTDKYTFLSDKAGVINRFYAKYDSAVVSVDTTINYRYFASQYPLSNLRRNILDYSVQFKSDRYTYLMYRNGNYEFYQGKLTEDSIVSLTELKLLSLKSVQKVDFNELDESTLESVKQKTPSSSDEKDYSLGPDDGVVVQPRAKNQESEGIDFDNYTFTDEEEARKSRELKNSVSRSILDGPDTNSFQLPERRNYRLNFTADMLQTQLDNSYNNNFYQPLNDPSTLNPGLGPDLTYVLTDLFEDYRLSGGVRFPFDLDNNDYTFSISNRKKRIDKTLTYKKQGVQTSVEGIQANIFKGTTHFVTYDWKYPFNEVFSVTATPALRMDRFVISAIEFTTLNAPNQFFYQGSMKLQAVFDNSLDLGTNLRSGFRAKAWIESIFSLDNNKFGTQVFGVDIRNYLPIHKNIIWANRLGASTTTGNGKVLYYMGGVDRWLLVPNFEDTELPDLSQFNYQSTVPPLRGFGRNIRNGNSFVVLNSEVRIPVFKYLIKRPVRNEFLETFQTLFFADAGTAWVGPNPFAEDNTFNTKEFQQDPITVRVKKRVNPIVGGYGFGFRGKLFGYFFRADWAWGLLDGLTQDRRFYLSLGLDF